VKIVFIGTIEFSFQILKLLIEKKTDIVGVITDLDRGINSDYADLASICNDFNIPFIQTQNTNSTNTVEWVKSLKPDYIFCFGWSKILKVEILQICEKGVIGFHPAKLPNNRGKHPLIWALILGLKETASTFFLMDKGVDSGDIISQKNIKIYDNDDAQSLYNKVIDAAKIQILELLPLLKDESYKRIKQDLRKSNIWRKRSFQDGQIDCRMNALEIHNLVRGLSRPYPGAHFDFQGEKFIVWRTELLDYKNQENIEPGKVISINNGIVIKCGDSFIKLVEIDPSPPLSVGDYL